MSFPPLPVNERLAPRTDIQIALSLTIVVAGEILGSVPSLVG